MQHTPHLPHTPRPRQIDTYKEPLDGLKPKGSLWSTTLHAVCAKLLSRLQRHGRTYKLFVIIALVGYLAKKIADRRARNKKARKKPKRVAVVGGGIAGTGAAWTLARDGVDVTLFEKKPKIGGNAKSFKWTLEDGSEVETGLSVLAWPQQLFHSYNALIGELGLDVEKHDLDFFTAERDPKTEKTTRVFGHADPHLNAPWVAADLEKWETMARFVRKVNQYFQPTTYPSVYRMSMLNPLNLISLRRLCRWYGISDRFWNFVFVPVHTSTFFEVNLDALPAVLVELLDDIVPFGRSPNMKTWKTHAYTVFERMMHQTREHLTVKTSCAVEQVMFRKHPTTGATTVLVQDEDGVDAEFDAVIFACAAPAMTRMLHESGAQGQSNLSLSMYDKVLAMLERFVLRQTTYTYDKDPTFRRGTVHSDAAAVFPQEYQRELEAKYCNYIEVDKRDPSKLENTFILSSWAPTVQHIPLENRPPMLITYNGEKKLENTESEWTVTSKDAHPCLSLWQLFAAKMLWPLLQGSREESVYFCGSAVTLGNGHDLSFLSGVVVASQLGAAFPFPKHVESKQDFDRLTRMMLSLL